MGGNTNSVPLDGNPTQIPLDENTTQASEGMNPIMNSTGKTPEQDQATQARQQAESDLRKKNNALNTAERTAVNDAARANRNQKPTSIPQTPQVQQADIDQKKAERALRDAEKMENDVYGQAIQKPGSRSRIGPTAQAEAADRAERERQKQQPQPAAPTVDPSNGGKRQNQPGAQTLVPVNPSTGGNRRDQARGGGANPPGGGANPPPEGATPATVGGANPLRGGANPAPVGAATLASEGASPATVGGANRSGGGANPSLERAVNPSTGGSRQDQPRATSPGQVLPDGRDLTPSQARKEKEDARKVQNEAKQDEKAEKDKALSGASDTPEWKRRREKREEARRNLAQADANEKSAIAKAKAGQGGNIAQPGGAANPTPAPVQAAAENNSQVPPATTPSGQVQPDGRDLTPSLAKKEKKEAQQAYNEAKKQEKAEKDKAFSSGASDTPKWRQAREKLEEARKKLAQADANEKHAIAKANAGQGGDGAHPGAAANPPRRGLANPPPGGAASPAPVESPPVVAVQEDEGSTSSSARKFWPFLLCLPLLLLLLPRSSGTSRAASAKSAVRLTNPTSPAPKWVVKDTPPVQINNVHAQGSDIPVNIGGGDGFVLPSMSYELPEINFTGPAEPARIVGMLAAVAIIMLPLFLDYMRDSTARIYVKTKYRSALVHWLILGVAALFLLWKADHELGITTRYSRPAATVANGVGSGIGPAIVAGVETTERLLWGAEDLIFGDGKYLLGLVLAAGFGVVLSQRSPKKDTNLANYASPASQALYAAGAVVVGFLLSNA
jgi:hypothetical protein